MFLSTNTCDGKRECIKQCPTKAINFINGKALSCLVCGICYRNCPNGAIFINSYGGYVVDRAKCNGCGMCMYNCPIDNSTAIDLNDNDTKDLLSSPLTWYDYNNENNKFVISEISADDMITGITLTSSSRA